ncbi:MAG: cysteine desulfuration protein SufE [Verrucomicrobiales bacterium]|nr:cysteine desulfuration protein SufE [Verrucomicrobiales bacterium]MDP6677717.1 SufE family protein [Verrucomicrobiota bacterium]MDP6753235.1 SufE family protein [Verrucomicrobiota bacterium]
MADFLDTTIDELTGNFEFLGDWEERFAYLIELGKKLPPLDESEMVEENRVHGCQAMVWLKMLPNADSTFEIRADSDAFIVKGLIAVLLLVYNRKTAEQIMATDCAGTAARLGLDKHLSPTRRNGLHSMVSRIQALAAESSAQIA